MCVETRLASEAADEEAIATTTRRFGACRGGGREHARTRRHSLPRRAEGDALLGQIRGHGEDAPGGVLAAGSEEE